MRYWTLFSSYQVFEIGCDFYTYSTTQFAQATFWVFNSHTWLVARCWTGQV